MSFACSPAAAAGGMHALRSEWPFVVVVVSSSNIAWRVPLDEQQILADPGHFVCCVMSGTVLSLFWNDNKTAVSCAMEQS